MHTKQKQPAHSLSDAVKDNIDSVAAFYEREEAKISGSQSVIEKISYRFGSPLYFGSFVLFAMLWIAINLFIKHLGRYPFDPPPFFWLQGFCGLNSVLITIAVLIRQNRMSRLEESRAHLNLQVNLLAEQKTTKLIQLMEELRRDLPNVRNRHDPEVETMQMQTNPHAMLDAIEAQKTDKQEN
jgi:uncharacterized membrane protein